jgi:acyl-coenzyme A thioesterase PaaI-like protein
MDTPGAVPEVFGDYFAGLEEQLSPSRMGAFFHQCFGCGADHPSGLRVRCFRSADEGVVSPIVIARRFEGPPGAAHGGIVAAYLDEVLASAVARATGRLAVTGELTVRYVSPVPTETAIVGRARLVEDRGRSADVEGGLEEFGTARLLASARGRFFFVEQM